MSRSFAVHDAHCPEIGPICLVRPEPPQQHHTTFWLADVRVLAEYGLRPNLAVQAMVPFRFADTRTRFTDLLGRDLELDYENIHHRNEALFGLGDAQLFVHHATRLGPVSAGARVGVNLPTGRVHENPYRLADLGLPHQHLQFGTGTFDPVAAVDAAVGVGSLTLAAFAHAHAPLYQGPTGYRAGTRLFGGVSLSHRLGETDAEIRLAVNGMHEFAERWDGELPEMDGNQGRTDIYVSPGITLPFAQDWSVSFDVRARAYSHVVGGQLDLPLVAEVSIGRLLHLESGAHDDGDEHGDDHGHEGAEHGHAHERRGDIADLVLEGEARPLQAVRGKWTVFDFWAKWCDACVALDRELREIAAERDDVAIRRVNIVDFDSPIALQELVGVSTLPRIRVVGPDGRILFEQSGEPDALADRLRNALKAR